MTEIEDLVSELGDEMELKRALALGNLNQNRLTAVESGFTWLSHVFQIDDSALGRVTTVLAELRAGDPDAHGGYWVDAENERVSMDEAEALAMLANAVAARLGIDQHYFDARDALNEATTVGEVQAVTITFGGGN